MFSFAFLHLRKSRRLLQYASPFAPKGASGFYPDSATIFGVRNGPCREQLGSMPVGTTVA
jgi:hypothetical protein